MAIVSVTIRAFTSVTRPVTHSISLVTSDNADYSPSLVRKGP